jgi:protein TonB
MTRLRRRGGPDGADTKGRRIDVDYAQQQRRPTKHIVGIGVVLAMHLLLGWALVSGLARKVVEVIKAPIETKIIEEVKPPPPPPENLPPPPKTLPPPPSYVPPPEVVVTPPPTPAPTITVTQEAPPPAAPVVIAPVAPEAPPAPAPVAAAPAAPVRTSPSLNFNACSKPEYPSAARRAEAEGTTVVVFTMDTNGAITDASVQKSSGPSREHKALDRATLEAVQACKGRAGTVDGKPEKLQGSVTYVWKLEN